MVVMAAPMNIGDHWAEAAGHESRWATRARVTPAGALAWSSYVRVVISSCAFALDFMLGFVVGFVLGLESSARRSGHC